MKFQVPKFLPDSKQTHHKWISFSITPDGFCGWLFSYSKKWKSFFDNLQQMGHTGIVIIPTSHYRLIADFLADNSDKIECLFVFCENTKVTFKFQMQDLTEYNLHWLNHYTNPDYQTTFQIKS